MGQLWQHTGSIWIRTDTLHTVAVKLHAAGNTFHAAAYMFLLPVPRVPATATQIAILHNMAAYKGKALSPAALHLCQLCHRWDTTSLTESPDLIAEPSPDGPSPTCEALLQAHEQQAAAAPLPRMDQALQQQQHEGALQQARQGAQQLLQEMQEGVALQEDAEQQQQQQELLLGKPRGTQTMQIAACAKACPGVGLCVCVCCAPLCCVVLCYAGILAVPWRRILLVILLCACCAHAAISCCVTL